MINSFINLCLVAFSGTGIWYAYTFLSGHLQLGLIFLCGLTFGIFIMNIKINVKNKKINGYKRELEKESISSDENAAKVKVLESKIEVLEKALENALKK